MFSRTALTRLLLNPPPLFSSSSSSSPDLATTLVPPRHEDTRTTTNTTAISSPTKFENSSSVPLKKSHDDFEDDVEEMHSSSRLVASPRRVTSTATTRSSLSSIFSSAVSLVTRSSSSCVLRKLDGREAQIFAILSERIRSVSSSATAASSSESKTRMEELLQAYEVALLRAGSSTQKKNAPARNAMIARRNELLATMIPPPILTWNTLIPLTSEIQCVDPGGQVFLSSIKPAYNLDLLDRCGITHLVSCIEGETMRFPRDRFVYVNYPILDRASFDIRPYISASNEFIRDAVMASNSGGSDERSEVPEGAVLKGERNGGKYRVLIYCGAGVSRSATLAMAFLEYYYRLPLDVAFTILKSVRPSVNPNDGFKRKLREFEMEMLSE